MSWRSNIVIKSYLQLGQVGIDNNTPVKVRKRVLLINNINLTTLTLIVPYTFLFFFLGLHKLAILLGTFFFLFSFFHYLTYKNRHFLSRTLILFSMNIALGVYSIVLGKACGLHFLFVVFFTLPVLIYDLKNYVLIALFSFGSVALFFFVRYAGLGPYVDLSPMVQKIISGVTALVAFGWLLLNKLYLIRANQLAENSLEESNQLLQSRNRDLEQFAYVASHDLQEPLRTVASYVELLEKQYPDKFDATGRKYIGYVVQSTHRLKKLIQDLLDYSRIGRDYQAKSVNIKTLVNETITDLQQEIAESNAAVSVSNLPDTQGYATDLKMLFQNLLLNGIKFSKPGQPPRVNINSSRMNDFWKFAVSDNGIGIEPQYCERIFIIFQRLHNRNEYEGNGIGLAHCKKIVEMHGGTIWVESEYGKGSTFYFTLPA